MLLQDLLDDLRGKTFQPSPEEQRAETSKKFIERCGYAAAALTLLPIPGTEAFAIMPLHVGMVTGIGQIYGAAITKDTATGLVLKIGTTVGLSFVGSRLATTAAKLLLPGLGGILGAPFMYGSTIAIGTVARAYFEQSGALSETEISAIYSDSLKQARSAFDPARARSAEAKAAAEAAAAQKEKAAADAAATAVDPTTRLEKLKELREKGLIEADEYEATKKRILAEL